ncbi:hypothetical protein BLNAU_9362 [Blattamonas nauphoetae]|uniref:Uncharacterized protein n=1 Tax=Blattamonas nauphoetae TaxID=2049346 RepID=A0ABQ9XW23_9EUKA|nr:hypothetical protein BLNAU_9362 [Blattamonas nauphoetae]
MGILIDSLIKSDLGGELVNTVVSEFSDRPGRLVLFLNSSQDTMKITDGSTGWNQHRHNKPALRVGTSRGRECGPDKLIHRSTLLPRKRLLPFFVPSLALEAHLPQLAIGIETVSRDITKPGHSAKTRKILKQNGIDGGERSDCDCVSEAENLLQVIQNEDLHVTATADSNPSLLLALSIFMSRGYTDPASNVMRMDDAG